LVHASIGIVVLDVESDIDVDTLLRNADVAMYVAKDRGKGRYQIYEPAMHDILIRRLELKADLQVALDHGEFALVYQPVVDLRTGTIVGVEALLRWRHPARGVVSPLEFVPLAEETGQIIQIGQWVLREACRYAVELRHDAARSLHMAVNLSARQLQDPTLLETMRRVLNETGFESSALVLEITETVMMRDMDASIVRLHELKALGVQLAIDDFGTGYSSLNYIRRFPVDILKIDKSFVDGIDEGGQGLALTSALIDLAVILKLRPVAEGIERIEQFERLREMGCDLGQGYFFSRPVESRELERLIAQGVPWPQDRATEAGSGQS
jgi:EAL domain-containing protein (putative c-di-GMP-specific phosphodiesterase class I)